MPSKEFNALNFSASGANFHKTILTSSGVKLAPFIPLRNRFYYGTYTTPPFFIGNNGGRIDKISWQGNIPPNTNVQAEVQFGPDDGLSNNFANWGDWQPLLTQIDGFNESAGTLLDNETVLLLHFNIETSPTEIKDSSPKGHIVQIFRNVYLVNTPSKFGDSAYFSGAGCLKIADCPDWDFGGEDFTIDFWIKRNRLTQRELLAGQTNSLGNRNATSVWIEISATDQLIVWVCESTKRYGGVFGTIRDYNWHHIAVVRNGNNLYGFVDGILRNTFNVTNVVVNNVNSNFAIGCVGDRNTYFFNGWMDEFRISKGIARWTRDFIPPSKEYHIETYGVDDKTKLLLHFNAEGANIIDSSFSNHIVEVYGDVIQVTNPSKFGKACFFDGNGDYLQIANSPDWEFGLEDFTIDFWIYINSFSARDMVVVTYFDTFPEWWVAVRQNGDGWNVWLNGGTNINDPLTTGVWYHVALVRCSDTIYFFRDGELKASWYSVNNDLSGRQFLRIGRAYDSGSHDLDAVIDELRISKGIARWVSNFIPPSQEYHQGLGIMSWNRSSEKLGIIRDASEKVEGTSSMKLEVSKGSLRTYVYREFGAGISLQNAKYISFYVKSEEIGIPLILHIDSVNSGISTVYPKAFPIRVIEKNVWREYRFDLSSIPDTDDLKNPSVGLRYIAFEINSDSKFGIWIDDIRIGNYIINNEALSISGDKYCRVRLTLSRSH